MVRVAIVGAGVSGLACAARLSQWNSEGPLTIDVFDKGRGPGGRLSTRRVALGDTELRFDHGAQYFTVRDPDFARHVGIWRQLGVTDRWQGRIVAINPHGRLVEQEGTRLVGVPGMNALVRHEAVEHGVQFAKRVTEVSGEPGSLHLGFEDGGTSGPYTAVAISAPSRQAADLLGAAPTLQSAAKDAVFAPCWAVMLAFEERLPLPFDGAKLEGRALGWIARDGAKPGRPSHPGAPETWVLHASPDWSKKHLEDEPDAVADHLYAEFLALATELAEQVEKPLPNMKPAVRAAHRWRYALVEQPAPSDDGLCLWDETLGLGACGDWCAGGRVEAAWLSGHALAGRMIDTVLNER